MLLMMMLTKVRPEKGEGNPSSTPCHHLYWLLQAQMLLLVLVHLSDPG